MESEKMTTRAFNHRERVRTEVGESSRTKESLAQETDINYIVSRFKKTGAISHVNQAAAKYGDFSATTDLKSAFDQVDEATAAFHALPAAVRFAAKNDPVVLGAMLESPEGLEALLKAENPPDPDAPAAAPPTPAEKPEGNPPTPAAAE